MVKHPRRFVSGRSFLRTMNGLQALRARPAGNYWLVLRNEHPQVAEDGLSGSLFNEGAEDRQPVVQIRSRQSSPAENLDLFVIGWGDALALELKFLEELFARA